MSSLSHCLKKLGISKHEAAILRGKANTLVGEGYEAHQAAGQAIKDLLDDLQTQRSEIVSQIPTEAPVTAVPPASGISDLRSHIENLVRRKGGMSQFRIDLSKPIDRAKQIMTGQRAATNADAKLFEKQAAIYGKQDKVTGDALQAIADQIKEKVKGVAAPLAAAKQGPDTQTFEQFATRRGAARADIGDAGLHRGSQNLSASAKKSALDRQNKLDTAVVEKRQELRAEYAAKVAAGEIRQPTKNERLIATANGNEDNESVKAARRLLTARGIDWKTQEVAAAKQELAAAKQEPGAPQEPKVRSLKQQANDARLKRTRNTVDLAKDNLFTAIGKLGGLNTDEARSTWGLDPKDRFSSGIIGKPTLLKTGRSIDDMAQSLADRGYLPVDEHGKVDVRDLEDAFQKHHSGAPVMAAEGYEAMAERRADEIALTDKELAESGYNDISQDARKAVDVTIDDDFFGMGGKEMTDAETEEWFDQGTEDAGQVAAGREGEGKTGSQKPDENNLGQAPPDFSLTGETEQEIRDREKAEAATKDAAEEKRIADLERDHFSLQKTEAQPKPEPKQGSALFSPKADYTESIVAEPTNDVLSGRGRQSPGRAKSAAELSVRRTPPRLRIVANGIRERLEKREAVALVGERINSPEDLAALAQIYRNPQYEVFRVFFTKGNQIVHATGVTARMPGVTPIFPGNFDQDAGIAWMRQQMGQADGYWLLHNHPSGNPKPSPEDIDVTTDLAKILPGFRGHVIINSNKYGVIRGDGTNNVAIKNFGPDLLLQASKPSAYIGHKVGGPDKIVVIGKSFQKDGWVTLVGQSGTEGVRAIAEVPATTFAKPMFARASIRRFARMTGSNDVFAYGTISDLQAGKVEQLVRDGFLKDAVTDAGGLRGHWGIAQTPGIYFGKPLTGKEVAQTRSAYNPALPSQGQSALPLTQGAVGGIALPEETRTQLTRRKIQDAFLRVRVIQDAVIDQGGTVDPAADIYLAEERFHGKVGSQIEKFQDETVEPLMTDISKSAVTLDEVAAYGYARHAPEANKRIASINQRFPDGGSGMTNKDAADTLAVFQKDGKTAELDAFAKRLDKIMKGTRDMLLREGLIDPQTHAAWEQMYQFYWPLKGLAKADENGKPTTGKGYDIRGPESKQRMGRKSRATDIVENILQARETAIVRVEKNQVDKALFNFVVKNPAPDLWGVNVVESKPHFVKATVNGNQVTLFGQNASVQNGQVVYKTVPKTGDNVFSVKIGGKEVHITIEDDLFARAMKQLGVENTIKGFSHLNRWLSLAYTGLNPVFTVVNFSRDSQTALVHTFEKGGIKYTGNTAKYVASAMRGVYRIERGKSSPEWQQWYDDFKADGGKMGWGRVLNIKEQGERLNRMIKMAREGRMNPKIPARWLFNFIMDSNAAVENSTRVASYRAARESGKSRAESASLAKNLTVNFNRKGEWAPVLSSLYLFFNPAVQGTARMMSALKNPKVQFLMAGITATHALLAMWNFAIAGDDEDGENRYAKLLKTAAYEAERNMIIMLPGGEGEYLKTPMPYGYNIFAVLGTQLVAMTYGAVSPAKAALNLYSAMMGSFNPIGGVIKDVKTLALSLAPTALDPVAQHAMNSTGLGIPIAPPDFPWDKRPESEKYYLSQHGSIGQTLAEAANKATGGNHIIEGDISVPPGVIDNWIRFFTGGAGQFLNDTGSVLLATVNKDKDIEAKNVPFLKTLYGKLDVKNDMRLFYDNRQKTKDALEVYEQHMKGGMREKGNKLLEENREMITLGDKSTTYDKELSKLRKEELRIVNDEGLPEREKSKQRKDVEVEKQKLFKRFNKEFRGVAQP